MDEAEEKFSLLTGRYVSTLEDSILLRVTGKPQRHHNSLGNYLAEQAVLLFLLSGGSVLGFGVHATQNDNT